MKKQYVRSISGEMVNKDKFLYNDQGIKIEPFFSGKVCPAINFDDNRALSIVKVDLKMNFINLSKWCKYKFTTSR